MSTPILSVAEAQQRIVGQVRPLPPKTMPLTSQALGLVLAEDVASDLDMPPFDKAMMDGYAVRSADVPDAGAELAVIEEVTAGRVPRLTVGPGQATRIMTGAPIPSGADAVVMIERTQAVDGRRVRLEGGVKPGQNVLVRGKEMTRGAVVLRAGARLRPQELGLLALVGRTRARVQPAPSVAILPTGDEIVEPGEKPGPGQIRNSNGPMLAAQTTRAGGVPKLLGIARDTEESLRGLIGEGLGEDVLVLSGGVSAGKLDLVPSVLADLGVRVDFHKVAMKPGKPMLFGVKDHGGRRPATLVFGLPGNPVSGLVCFELFVRPAIRGLMALPPGPVVVQATLTEDHAYRTDRPTYHPARLESTDAGWRVQAVPWFGSADLRGVTPANAFVLLPAGDHQHRAGDVLPVLMVEDMAACGLAFA
ncbi:MAG: molybdopterin molybdotransferase MoeA [Gemmataceae bacterium]|nr:molybdopterin molybdotransferase MoeA [Gemmataceae bacterium]